MVDHQQLMRARDNLMWSLGKVSKMFSIYSYFLFILDLQNTRSFSRLRRLILGPSNEVRQCTATLSN